jgi:hypothetical protein
MREIDKIDDIKIGDMKIDHIDDIKSVHIKLNTNNTKQLLLKANMFAFADGKTIMGEGEGYPFACLVRRVYNTNYFDDKSHFERVQVFFNKKAFETFLSTCGKDDKNDVSRDNMRIMLNVLFPVSFPIKDQVTSLFDEPMSIMEAIATVFGPNEYSYLKVDNIDCTVTQVTWLDIVTKNPTYVEMANLFIERFMNIVRFMQEKVKKGGKSSKDANYDTDLNEMSQYLEKYKNKDINFGEKGMRSVFNLSYDDQKRSSLWWKMHFLFENFKMGTSAYTEFVNNFTRKFSDKNVNYWEINSKFEKAFSDLDFYFDYMKKLENFIPPYRESTNPVIANLFREEESRRNIDIDEFLKFFPNGESQYSGIDIVREKPAKQNDWSIEVKPSKSSQMFYEVQLVVSLVEGKLDDKTSDDMLCKLKSRKLVKDYEYLSKYKSGEVKFYPYISSKDLSELPDVKKANDQKPPDSLSSILKTVGGRRRKRTNVKKKHRRHSKTRKR